MEYVLLFDPLYTFQRITLNTLVNFYLKYIENYIIDQMILKHLKTFRILMSGHKLYKKPLLKLRQRTFNKLLCIERMNV